MFALRRVPLCAVLLLAGCASFGNQPQVSWYGLDPHAPLGAQDQVQVHKLPEVAPPVETRRAPTELPKEGADLSRLQPQPLTKPIPPALRLEPEEATTGDGLELSVAAPARKKVGSHATYRLTLRNASDRTVAKVAVDCRFDAPLAFDGSDKHRVVQKFEQLLPGEAKDLTLSLFSSEAGSHCCRFTVLTGEGDEVAEVTTKSVCVEFVSRQLQLDVLGPTLRTVASRAEFAVTLTNHSEKTLTEVRAVLSYDKALVPREASAGKQAKPGSLSWDLGTLQPMESVQLQVDFECQAPARRACVALDVRSEQGAAEQEEACLEIVPVSGTLDLQVTDRDDPLEVGKTGRYEVKVHNIGLQAARQILLEARVPDHLKVVSTRVLLGEDEIQVGVRQESGRLIFDEIPDLAADGRLTYLIDVTALTAGIAEFRVRLTSSLSGTPTTTAEPTIVVEP